MLLEFFGICRQVALQSLPPEHTVSVYFHDAWYPRIDLIVGHVCVIIVKAKILFNEF